MVEPFLQCIDHRPHLREGKTTAAHKTFCENNYTEILFAKEDEQDKKARN